jgi:class 3 adenylate cyclase
MDTTFTSQYEKFGDLEAICIAFFDLVDSTALKNQLGQSAGVNLAVSHNKLAGDICQKYKGRIIKYIGDAIMVVFNNPLEAMLASLELISTLHERQLPFRTKIGFNHGIATKIQSNGIDYYGQSVDRTARLNSQALPNQIITDETTIDMIKPFLSDFKQIIYRFLGVRSLKGIGNVPLYELSLQETGFAEEKDTVAEIRLGSANPVTSKPKAETMAATTITMPPLAVPQPFIHLVKDKPLGEMLRRCTPAEADLNAVAVGFQNLSHIFDKAHDLNIRQVSLSGALTRGTMIRPYNEIDVIVVIPAPQKTIPPVSEILNPLQAILSQWNPGVEITNARNRLFITLQGIVFSITPVYAVLEKDRGHLLMPVGALWINRNPAVPERWMEEAIKRNGQTFLPFLRLINAWRRTHANIVSTFHIEMFTDFIAKQASLDLSFESVHRWFRYAYTYFSQNEKPFIKDPVQPKQYIDEYLYTNSSLFNIFGRALTNSYDLARQGIAHHRAGQHNVALTKWKALFGSYMDDD